MTKAKPDTPRVSKKRRKESIAWRINLNLITVLIPSLIIMIIISCLMAAQSIQGLSNELLDIQAEYAVSIVDDFFSGKTAALSMYERDSTLSRYFQSMAESRDVYAYEDMPELLNELSYIAEHMEGEELLQVWVVDEATGSYLLSTGETGQSDLPSMEWYRLAHNGHSPVVSDPYTDSAKGENVISVVTPVFDDSDSELLGFLGVDVSMNTLNKLLSSIRVGENGFMELLSNDSVYIYSTDPTAVNKSVNTLDIADDYKNKVLENYNGGADFSYMGTRYTAIFRNSQATGWLAIATLPVSEMNAARNHLIFVMTVISAAVLILLILVILTIVRKTTSPLSEISTSMETFAKGNLDVKFEVHSQDEVGKLAESAKSTIMSLKEMIEDTSAVLLEVSKGDLTAEVKGQYAGDFKSIKNALVQIISSLNATLYQINIAAEQVSTGAEQVSDNAQALAQGASEQAGTVEELAASIDEISVQITSNAGNSDLASKKAMSVRGEAVESNRRMQEMLKAMEDIKDSTKKIGSILKAIEDIAFQTNILALNASVEAARAGDAGKGFSVVAMEVRNLASKSSKAAKDTNLLIENSLKAVESGTIIADDTAAALSHVVEGAEDVSDKLDEISKASSEQATYVEQLTRGILQISNVIQGNSATAEEIAAASEELSAQAALLKHLLEQFHTNEL